jgi:hypothetical protein
MGVYKRMMLPWLAERVAWNRVMRRPSCASRSGSTEPGFLMTRRRVSCSVDEKVNGVHYCYARPWGA